MTLQEKIDTALKRFHFYSGLGWQFLPLQDKEILLNHATKINIKKKDILFHQGSFPSGIYILQSGKLKVYQLNFDGSIQIHFIYAPGELFGYRPILSEEYHPVTAAALENCELLFIERHVFLDLLNTSHTLSNRLLVSLSHEFTVLTNRMNVFAQRGIKERLALSLLILNEKFKTKKDIQHAAEIKLSRADLADYVGTSLETLVRTLNFFKEKKLIKTKGKSILITHFENLYILSAIG